MSVSAANGAHATSSGAWARWKNDVTPYTVGVEEEVMLLNDGDMSLAGGSDAIINLFSPELVEHTSKETHTGIVELRTGVNRRVAGAISELRTLRRRLAVELRSVGTTPACAGMHPLASAQKTRISGDLRYRFIASTMRSLAHGEPTMALHVHIAVPDPDDATGVLRRMRDNVPLLVALAANSPFSRGRDSGFASARTTTFDGFPRTGPPRAFVRYREYVDAIDPLIFSGALPDPTFLWWDVRLQPALGTVEVRVMDAQSTIAEIAPLVALVQSLARLELEGPRERCAVDDEALAENRFLAARDGLEARLIDPTTGRLMSARRLLRRLTEECRPHAAALGCLRELEEADALVEANGAIRQRTWVRTGGDMTSMLSRLSEQFAIPTEHAPEALSGAIESLPSFRAPHFHRSG